MFEPRRDVVRKRVDVGLHFVGPAFLSLALIQERLGVRLPAQVAPQLAQGHASRGPSVGRPAPSQIIAATSNPAAVARSASRTLRVSRGPRRLSRGTAVWGEGGSEPVKPYSSPACLTESVHMIQ